MTKKAKTNKWSDALAFLNPDFMARNLNTEIDKKQSQLREKEIEKAERLKEQKK